MKISSRFTSQHQPPPSLPLSPADETTLASSPLPAAGSLDCMNAKKKKQGANKKGHRSPRACVHSAACSSFLPRFFVDPMQTQLLQHVLFPSKVNGGWTGRGEIARPARFVRPTKWKNQCISRVIDRTNYRTASFKTDHVALRKHVFLVLAFSVSSNKFSHRRSQN